MRHLREAKTPCLAWLEAHRTPLDLESAQVLDDVEAKEIKQARRIGKQRASAEQEPWVRKPGPWEASFSAAVAEKAAKRATARSKKKGQGAVGGA